MFCEQPMSPVKVSSDYFIGNTDYHCQWPLIALIVYYKDNVDYSSCLVLIAGIVYYKDNVDYSSWLVLIGGIVYNKDNVVDYSSWLVLIGGVVLQNSLPSFHIQLMTTNRLITIVTVTMGIVPLLVG